ncbi:uncharacterized protein BDV14DRAFT_162529 [Aspergillus stella-maris]|uniref:uncharacterized protein n=1 Tax=Aspergillus stella-maris TaxID=1810926 RepID=UPI003CCCDDFF
MSLLSLPTELLCSLPDHIDNIESFTSLASTCRTLRAILNNTHPRTILHLADSSAPTFFSPHPHFLITATAQTISDWALGNEERTATLRQAFRGGIYALYELILEHGTLTLDRIREMYNARFDIINPLSDKIDKMAGKQWMQAPRFWMGGVSEPATLYTDADRATFQILIYGELFRSTMDAFLSPGLNLPSFDIDTRLDYLKFTLADEREPNAYEVGATDTSWAYYSDMDALRHIVLCGRWKRMWGEAIKDRLDGGFGEHDGDVDGSGWRGRLLRDALIVQGVKGMSLVTRKQVAVGNEGVVEGGDVELRYLSRARNILDKVRALEKPPEVRYSATARDLEISHAPDISGELDVAFLLMP